MKSKTYQSLDVPERHVEVEMQPERHSGYHCQACDCVNHENEEMVVIETTRNGWQFSRLQLCGLCAMKLYMDLHPHLFEFQDIEELHIQAKLWRALPQRIKDEWDHRKVEQ